MFGSEMFPLGQFIKDLVVSLCYFWKVIESLRS